MEIVIHYFIVAMVIVGSDYFVFKNYRSPLTLGNLLAHVIAACSIWWIWDMKTAIDFLAVSLLWNGLAKYFKIP